MKAKKVMALMLCAAMVTSMSATAAFAAEEKEDAATEKSADSTAAEDPTAQFDGLKANEAYVFPMMVKSFQSTYWDAAQEGMKKASKELGVDYKPQGPNSESDIADLKQVVTQAAEPEKVFDMVEQMPTFPGGQQELMAYLGKNIKYPTIAQENGTQGRVIIQFVVERDGTISDVHVARGVDPYLDKEAVRVVQSMPKWIPGKQNGKAVRVKFTVPVMFRLQ